MDHSTQTAHVFEAGSGILEAYPFEPVADDESVEFFLQLMDERGIPENVAGAVALPPNTCRQPVHADFQGSVSEAMFHIWGMRQSVNLRPDPRIKSEETSNRENSPHYSFNPQLLLGSLFGALTTEAIVMRASQMRTNSTSAVPLKRLTRFLDEKTRGAVVKDQLLGNVSVNGTGSILRKKLTAAAQEVATSLFAEIKVGPHAVVAGEYAVQRAPNEDIVLQEMMREALIMQFARNNGHASPTALLTHLMKHPDAEIRIPGRVSVRAYELFHSKDKRQSSDPIVRFIKFGLSGAFVDTMLVEKGLTEFARVGTGRSDILMLDAVGGRAVAALNNIKALSQKKEYSYQQPQLSFRLLPPEVLAAQADFYWSWLQGEDGTRIIPVDMKGSFDLQPTNGKQQLEWERYMGEMMSSLVFAQMLGVFRVSPNPVHRLFVADFYSSQEPRFVAADNLIAKAIERTSASIVSIYWPIVTESGRDMIPELRGINPVSVHQGKPVVSPLTRIDGQALAQHALERLHRLNTRRRGKRP